MNNRGHIVRGIIYVGLIAGFVFLVIGKQQVIRGNREQTIISVISEWQSVGKPVVVRRAVLQDVDELLKITLSGEGAVLQSDVPKAVWKRLAVGQTVFGGEERVLLGKIQDLGKEVDVETGLYPVKVFVNKPWEKESKGSLARVAVDKFKNVLIVPDESVSVEKGARVIWTVVDEKARQAVITVSRESDEGVVVETGLKPGDLLVVEGQSMLREGDKVSMHEESL